MIQTPSEDAQSDSTSRQSVEDRPRSAQGGNGVSRVTSDASGGGGGGGGGGSTRRLQLSHSVSVESGGTVEGADYDNADGDEQETDL